MLAAQGFQESQLNQNAKSHVGAVGVMQIMPATGAELNVGDIHTLEPNIHAGAKYMDRLMTRYFSDAHFSDEDRTLFAFASYNAGPGNIARMRRLAEKRGLDPNQWFNNVELVVADRIGIETTTYVRNIYKYYVAYKLTLRAREVQQRAREGVPTGEKRRSDPGGDAGPRAPQGALRRPRFPFKKMALTAAIFHGILCSIKYLVRPGSPPYGRWGSRCRNRRVGRMRANVLLKAVVVGFLALVFVVPLVMIWGVVKDRSRYRDTVTAEVARSTAQSQTLVGPSRRRALSRAYSGGW